MKIFIIFLLLLLIGTSLYAQQDRISVKLVDADAKTTIQAIESLSSYNFFYEVEWFLEKPLRINATFINETIESVLTTIFEKTDFNFHIYNQSIILTKNKVIYDKLDNNFFTVQKNITQKQDSISNQPLFFKQLDSVNVKKQTEITVIGKERNVKNKKALVLSGYIKNQKTGETLPNCFIKVLRQNKSTLSDKNGYYTVTLSPGINLLEISNINFSKIFKKIILYDSGVVDIFLKENITNLDEVVISTKKNEKVRAAIAGVTSIDMEGIKNVPLVLGERDIFKVAATLPGIKTTGEGSAGFNVRGGKEDQNLVLLDNGLIYNPAHFFGFFSAVNPFTTKKATIYKGSIPAEFGGRLSSVFDITTKTGNLNVFAGEGGIGPVTSNVMISTPVLKNKSSLLVGVRATYSGWILRSLDDERLKNSKASFFDGIVKYSHKIDTKNSIDATFYYSNDAFNITNDSLYKYSNRLATLKWERIFSEKFRSSFVVTNSEYKFNIDFDSKFNALQSFDFGFKINETQAILKLNQNLSNRHKITYGLSSKLYAINPGYLAPKNTQSLVTAIDIEQERGLESAAFVSDSYKITKNLLIDVGFRYSNFLALGKSSQRNYKIGVPLTDASVESVQQFEENKIIKTFSGFEPRIAARYLLGNDLAIKIGYDKTFQYIHLLSSNTTQSPTDTWKLSDLNVKPQSGAQFSAGLFKNLQEKDIEMSIEAYYKKSRNFLDFKVASQLLLNENIETELLQGEGKAYGIEFLVRKNSGRLNGWIGYTFSRTLVKLDSQFNDERVNNGNFFAANFDKPHDVSVVLNYRFTKRYSFSSNFVYQTGRPITYPIGIYSFNNSQFTLYSDRNQFRIPDYYRLDVGFNVEGSHRIKKLAHSFWNISIYNILGRNNPYSVFFVTDKGQVKAYQTSIFAIPVPTITYNFKF